MISIGRHANWPNLSRSLVHDVISSAFAQQLAARVNLRRVAQPVETSLQPVVALGFECFVLFAHFVAGNVPDEAGLRPETYP